MMPTLFVSHGAPDRVLTTTPATNFLRQLSKTLPKPKGILIVSAHWQTSELCITNTGEFSIQHGHYGFSAKLSHYRYQAMQSKELTQQVTSLLNEKQLNHNKVPASLDHGSWSVLSLMYPLGDIPVINLSLPSYSSIEHYLTLGNKLSQLRKEGILIIGSGSATHNLSQLSHEKTPPEWAQHFVQWLHQNVASMNLTALANIYKSTRYGQMAHPTLEHYLPLLISAGAAKDEKSTLLHNSYEYGSLNNSSFLFGAIDPV